MSTLRACLTRKKPSENTRKSMKCSYMGCGKYCNKYRFPITQKERFEKWIENSGNMELKKLSKRQMANRLVCGDHFRQNDFPNLYRIRLNINAVPIPYKQKIEETGINNKTNDEIDGENNKKTDYPLNMYYSNMKELCMKRPFISDEFITTDDVLRKTENPRTYSNRGIRRTVIKKYSNAEDAKEKLVTVKTNGTAIIPVQTNLKTYSNKRNNIKQSVVPINKEETNKVPQTILNLNKGTSIILNSSIGQSGSNAMQEVQQTSNNFQIEYSDAEKVKLTPINRKKCSYLACNRFSGKFYFPVANEELCKKWIEHSGYENELLKVRKSVLADMIICEKHFKPTDFENSHQIVLKPNVFPISYKEQIILNEFVKSNEPTPSTILKEAGLLQKIFVKRVEEEVCYLKIGPWHCWPTIRKKEFRSQEAWDKFLLYAVSQHKIMTKLREQHHRLHSQYLGMNRKLGCKTMI